MKWRDKTHQERKEMTWVDKEIERNENILINLRKNDFTFLPQYKDISKRALRHHTQELEFFTRLAKNNNLRTFSERPEKPNI